MLCDRVVDNGVMPEAGTEVVRALRRGRTDRRLGFAPSAMGQ